MPWPAPSTAGIGRRRRVQTIVIALVLVVSTASSVLGLALVVDSHATFDHVFSAQRGAHLVVTVTRRARRRRNSPPPPASAIIGLVMFLLIVANVVRGAVIAGYHRIGILKSIGFTPVQVIAAYTGQVSVPAVLGCLGGVALGNLLAVPLLHKTADVYGVGRLGVPLWVNVTMPLAMCGRVALAAGMPALRAGRLSATRTLTAGRAPRNGRGYLAHRLLGRMALPRPVTIGLASPFARPTRTAATLAAVPLGVTAVTFAIGLVTRSDAPWRT